MLLDIIKEQYKKMPDEKLIRFAINESQQLTIESFYLLRQEFELRNLDIAIIEEAETEKALSDLNKQTTFEKTTANEYTQMIWKFALEEKGKGSTDTDVFNKLRAKGVEENYAHMLIETLELKSRELVDSYDTDIIIGWIIFPVGILMIVLVVSGNFREIFSLYGLLLIIGGVARLATKIYLEF
jgi:hypothetical protein